MVLGLDFVRLKDAWHGAAAPGGPMELRGEGGGNVAPTYMGADSRAAVDHFIGNYLTIRPAFSVPGAIIAYRTDILWDPDWPSLLFEERERPDAPYAHRGRLYIPASSPFIHLVSLTKGAMRMVVVSQVDRAGEMRGIITTLNKQRALFLPVSAPIVYAKREAFGPNAFGEIREGAPQFAPYKALLYTRYPRDTRVSSASDVRRMRTAIPARKLSFPGARRSCREAAGNRCRLPDVARDGHRDEVEAADAPVRWIERNRTGAGDIDFGSCVGRARPR